MLQVSLSYIRHSDGQISGLDAYGITASQLRYYALASGFGIVGDPASSSIYIGGAWSAERLICLLESVGYEIDVEIFDFSGCGQEAVA